MTYKIPIPKNSSFQECLWFLDRNYDDCLHEVRPISVRKAIFIDKVMTLIEISEIDNQLIVKVLIGNNSEKEIVEFVKDWFDYDRDKVLTSVQVGKGWIYFSRISKIGRLIRFFICGGVWRFGLSYWLLEN